MSTIVVSIFIFVNDRNVLSLTNNFVNKYNTVTVAAALAAAHDTATDVNNDSELFMSTAANRDARLRTLFMNYAALRSAISLRYTCADGGLSRIITMTSPVTESIPINAESILGVCLF